MRTLIHLVRHAEVENPRNVWYGRLEGFKLSERGRRQAEALAKHLSGHDLAAIYSSPLERAIETAEAIARPLGLQVTSDPDLIESETRLQGKYGDIRLFRNPLNIRFFLNPYRPSWGETYSSIAERMLRALDRMREAHPGGEAIAVSHMTPITVARLKAEGRRVPAWRSGIVCARASITTLTFEDGRFAGSDYVDVGSQIR